MQRILLYIVLVAFFFWGFHQVKSTWESNEGSLDATYADVKSGVLNWYQSATDSSKDLKEKLNAEMQNATQKYNKLKNEIESVSTKVNEKQNQLEKALKEMEEAKKALDQLLDREKQQEAKTTSTE
jgi:predicted  nucleic acid-binding Zn-ribbon protein